MGVLREIFDRPVTGDGLRGDTLLPPLRRRDGTPPAAFAFDPDEARDGHGRWAAGGTPAVPPMDRATGPTPALQKAAHDWKAGLSEPEANALANYTSGGYHRLNSPLRQEPSGLSLPAGDFETAQHVATAVARFPAGASVTSYRGVRMRDAKKRRAFTRALDAAARTGDAITLHGFSSATLDPDLAARWGDFVLKIDSPRGAYVAPASADPSEEEVLHQHGESFTVTGVTKTRYAAATGEGRTRTTYHLAAVKDRPDCPLLTAAFYDPGEARDAHGRWAAGEVEGMKQLTAAWSWDLTHDERHAIRMYAGAAYRRINSGLRACPETLDCLGETVAPLVRDLDSALRKYPRHPPQTSWRGMTVRDDHRWAQIKAAFEAAHATGQPLTLNGFTSSSLDPRIAACFAGGDEEGRAVLEVRSTRSAFLGTAAPGGEKEVLHNHGQKFRVVAVESRVYLDWAEQPFTRPTYVLEAVDEEPPPLKLPAKFYDEGQPRDERGRWAAIGERLGVADTPAGELEPPGPPTFPAVAAYVRGRALAAAVAALPHRRGEAARRLAEATAAFKQWPKDHPDAEEFGPEHRRVYAAVERAEEAERQARREDRADFLAACGKVQELAWAPDTSGLSLGGWNKPAFNDALAFVRQLVPAATGVDPRVIVADDRAGPSYTPGRNGEPGYVAARPRTNSTAFAHELGHHVEFTQPGAVDLANEFLDHRAAGETPRRLSELGLTQDETATGVRDHFDRTFGPKGGYYVGRRYANTRGTEVVAMGVEALFDDPVFFARADPEYFAFVVGVLSGDLLTTKGAGHAR